MALGSALRPEKGRHDADDIPPSTFMPLHAVTWKCFAEQPGRVDDNFYNLTGEIVNEFLLAPVILRILYVGLKNVPI